jgi:hypothetical protein
MIEKETKVPSCEKADMNPRMAYSIWLVATKSITGREFYGEDYRPLCEKADNLREFGHPTPETIN